MLSRGEASLQKCLAPVTTADFFKSRQSAAQHASTIDLDNFLSKEGRRRQPSSLKASAAALGREVISLSTKRPSISSYTIEELRMTFSDTNILQSESHKFVPESASSQICKRRDPSADIDLSIALSYGYSLGSEQLIRFLTQHVEYYHSPPYSDWEVCLTIGNTSALEITLRSFADPGDWILVERHTYSGMIEACIPLGLNLVPVAMDEQGLCPTSLDALLSNWSEQSQGRKPRLLYMIPTGQNPTGITQPLQRRKDILAVAEKHDLLIIEDDPYYFLQYPTASSDSLVASYLSLCNSGRVIRLDSTSKILAPGIRLGWLTAPKKVVAVYQASHDLGIVHPSGLAQLVVYKQLNDAWGHGGFATWLRNLAAWYERKGTVMESNMKTVLGSSDLGQICSWTRPDAGMFVWLVVDCSRHIAVKGSVAGSELQQRQLDRIEDEIYEAALDEGVMCCKGSNFTIRDPARESAASSVCFRLTFATVSAAVLEVAITNMVVAIRRILLSARKV
ncbi:Aminotransferase swnA-like protein [Elsinoe fawcettii]|nr:Aminotransferase swnA-like protein [Elsinoe fawcettii]